MNKAFVNFTWRNEPRIDTPINETNLNKINNALDTVDNRVITLDTSKANQSDLLQTLKTVNYNTSTGLFTFTYWNGNTVTADLNVEKIPVSFSMSAQGVITMETADGTRYTCDVSTLIKEYNFAPSSDIRFNVVIDANGNRTVTAFIVDGAVTASKIQPDYLANVTAQAESASASADAALLSANNSAADALLSQSYAIGNTGIRTGEDTDNAKYYKEQTNLDGEAWTRGTRNNVPVTSGDPTYENNAKYYAELATTNGAAQVANSEAWATGTRNGIDVSETDSAYQNNSKYYSEQSANYAEEASLNGEAWARGTRDGIPIPITDEAYNNHAKYYAEQSYQNAEAWATGTRNGEPVPITDDAYNNHAKYYSEQSANYSEESALNGEAWARGTRNKVPVASTDEEYHNNSKYYSEQSSLNGEAWSRGTRNGVPVASTDVEYQNNSRYYAEQSSLNGEAWARGTRNGEPVSSTDEEYRNNGKYYAELASQNGEAWSVGTRNGIPVSNLDPEYQNNAKYYTELANIYQQRAQEAADAAQSIVGIGIATPDQIGLMKPDNNTVFVDESDGTLTAGISENDWLTIQSILV